MYVSCGSWMMGLRLEAKGGKEGDYMELRLAYALSAAKRDKAWQARHANGRRVGFPGCQGGASYIPIPKHHY